jgi:fructokinase
MDQSPTYAGVELGGTKCVAILARSPDEIVSRKTVPTTTPDETLRAIAEILSDWRSDKAPAALGVASFGPLDIAAGAIATTPKPGWTGTQVREPLARAAGVPVAFDTDVNGAALAEMRWGSGRGFADFAYITVGTGVGVGLIANGRPTRGFLHSELGHIRVAQRSGGEWGGACTFHGSCVEGLASGPAIVARIKPRSLDELAPDDPVWDSVGWALAQLCQAIVCAAAPQAIAIGGGVIDKQPHLLARVEQMLIESLNGYVQLPAAPYVRAPELGIDAGPLGAIALAMTARP